MYVINNSFDNGRSIRNENFSKAFLPNPECAFGLYTGSCVYVVFGGGKSYDTMIYKIPILIKP